MKDPVFQGVLFSLFSAKPGKSGLCDVTVCSLAWVLVCVREHVARARGYVLCV